MREQLVHAEVAFEKQVMEHAVHMQAGKLLSKRKSVAQIPNIWDQMNYVEDLLLLKIWMCFKLLWDGLGTFNAHMGWLLDPSWLRLTQFHHFSIKLVEIGFILKPTSVCFLCQFQLKNSAIIRLLFNLHSLLNSDCSQTLKIEVNCCKTSSAKAPLTHLPNKIYFRWFG